MSHRILALLLCIALTIYMLPAPTLAEEVEDEDGIIYVAPTLPDNAIAWDDEHPDLMDETMLYAKSAILIEASTGEVIFEKNADEIMFPASTTKILTGYIALQMADLENDLITVSQNAIDLVPSGYQKTPLSSGEEVNMKDMIGAMLVLSANDAANAVAEYISGSVENFAELMNQTAEMLGCSQDTHFTNPSGAHDPNHYTTARDLAIITRVAMQDERFREYVSMTTYNMPASNKRPARTLVGGTSILKPEDTYYYYPMIGVKTGYTDASGYCFVGAARKGNIELISVVLYSSKYGRWTDTRKLMEYGFTQIESISPESLYAEDPRTIDVYGFSLDDPYHGELTLGIRAVDPDRDMTIIGTTEKIDLLRESFGQLSAIEWVYDQVRAPVNAGDVLGILTFYSENDGTAEYELVATRSIAAREDAPPSLAEIEAYTREDGNPFPRFSTDMLVPPAILLFILWLILRFIRRHRKRRPKAPDIKPIPKRYLR